MKNSVWQWHHGTPSHAWIIYQAPTPECMCRTMRKLAQHKRRRAGGLNSRTNARNRWMGPRRAAAGEEKRPLLTFSMTEESDQTAMERQRSNAPWTASRWALCGARRPRKKQETQVAAPATGSGLWPLPCHDKNQLNDEMHSGRILRSSRELKTAAIWPQWEVFVLGAEVSRWQRGARGLINSIWAQR